MTGRPVSIETALTDKPAGQGENVLEVAGLSSEGLFENVSFSVRKGTIVGIAGVIGAGKSELARAIVGALPEGTRVTGRVTMEGKEIDVRSISPGRARDLAIGFVSEDRQAEGIVQEQPVLFNIILPALRRAVAAFTIVARKARPLALSVMDAVNLRPRDPDRPVALLSGGNQQKVVIGKWLAAQSRLLILDEPTRGIDVGARQEIYDVIRALAKDKGLAVLLLSSDLREILVASDRILVMSRGRITREIAPEEANEKSLLDMVLPPGDGDPARQAEVA